MSRSAPGSCRPRPRSEAAPWAVTSLCRGSPGRLLCKDEDEEHRERQVDEVRRFDQADGEEEQGLQLTLRFGLAGYALDQRATGKTVTNGCADCATTERH